MEAVCGSLARSNGSLFSVFLRSVLAPSGQEMYWDGINSAFFCKIKIKFVTYPSQEGAQQFLGSLSMQHNVMEYLRVCS